MIQNEKATDHGLVSIVMLSHNRAQYVEESVRSVMAQTYQNWELLFVDDNSKDNTITMMMDLKNEAKIRREDYSFIERIKVSQTIVQKGDAFNRNVSLKEARGRWIAFLDAGDVWAPEKLEKQITFMEENDYAVSYTAYGLMDRKSRNRGVVVSGKAHVTHKDMLKCCWPAYLTVMYDAQKVGLMQVRCSQNNDYALWLNVTDKHDCHLLQENLATARTKWRWVGKILLTDNAKWRYDAYRMDEDLKPVTAFLYTIRNGVYGMVKWLRYVKRSHRDS